MDVSGVASQAGISHAMASESPGNTSPMNLSHIGHRAFGSNVTGNCTGDRKSGECGKSTLVLTSSRPFSTLTTSTLGRSHSCGASTSMYFTTSSALWLLHFRSEEHTSELQSLRHL